MPDQVTSKNKTLTRRLLPALAFWIGLLNAVPAHAARDNTDYFALPPEQLLKAEITSVSKRPEPLNAAPAAIHVITQDDIMRTGAKNITDALRHVPGIHVAQLDANTTAVSIRGFNGALTNKLLVLIDGRIVYNPVFGGVMWEVQDLMMENIERIEVIRGPGGSLWGANAVNGVINIITFKAHDTPDNLVSLSAGNNRKQVNLRHSGATGDDGAYRIHARRALYDSSRHPRTALDQSENTRAGFRFDNSNFSLLGDAYKVETAQRFTAYDFIAPYARQIEHTIGYQGANLLGRWQDNLADGSTIALKTYFDYTRRDEPWHFIDSRLIYDLEAEYSGARQGAHEITLGGGYRLVLQNQKNSINTVFTPARRSDQLASLFAQDKITLIDNKLFLTLGSKFEHNDYTGFEIQPNARLQWHPRADITVWGAISRAVRTPTPLETDIFTILGAAPGVQASLHGNDDFKSEKLTAYEIGYRHQLTPALSLDATAFYNDYDRLAALNLLPTQVITTGPGAPYLRLPLLFQNNMTGHAYGTELSAHWAVTPRLRLSANYSYMNLALDSHANVALNQEGAEDQYPPQQFSLRAAWDVNDRLSIDSTAHYTDHIKGFNIKDHVRLDLNIGYRLAENIRLDLSGHDLLDDSHREFGSATDQNAGEAGRTLLGTVTWRF